MATTKNAPEGATSTVEAGEIPLSLGEFCTRLSSTDRRVELIGGFHSQEAAAGRTQDVESGFAARFAEFITQPA